MTAQERAARLTYVLVEENEDVWLIKLGCTKDWRTLHRRRQNLQTGNPRRLHIGLVIMRPGMRRAPWATCPTITDPESGYVLEQKLLEACFESNIPETEWLIGLTPSDIATLAKTGELK